jgi:hypothetical protein
LSNEKGASLSYEKKTMRLMALDIMGGTMPGPRSMKKYPHLPIYYTKTQMKIPQ